MGYEERSGEGCIGLDEVLRGERETIAARRRPSASGEERGPIAGLAFSGGGIRSAVFNLGFIQGLARHDALHLFDYLSTVSGGGYIGSWLSALHYRRHAGASTTSGSTAGEEEMRALQKELCSPCPDSPAEAARQTGFPVAECAPIRFIRRYSNYLTPRLGLSGDTLTLASLMVRNVMVMQLLLVSLSVALFSGLLLLVQGGEFLAGSSKRPVWLVSLLVLSVVLLATALRSALTFQRRWDRSGTPERSPARDITLRVLLPVLVAGVAAGMVLAKIEPPIPEPVRVVVALVAATAYLLLWRFGPAPHRIDGDGAGVAGGAATLGGLCYLLLRMPVGEHPLAFAPLASMVIFALTITVHLALAGTAVTEQIREWWARLGGQGVFLACGWTAIFLFLLYVPPVMQYGWEEATHWLLAGGGLWSLATWIGTSLARGGKTGSDGGRPLDMVAKVAPWLFVVGLLGLVAWLFVVLLPGIELGAGSLVETIDSYHEQLRRLPLLVPALLLFGVGLLFLLLLRRIDLNLFSAHSFYTNRLARTFLGASQRRRAPDPYTGLDPHDDLPLARLAGQRPIHLVNATLNLTGGGDLAWQTRRGASFTLSPRCSGFASRDSRGNAFGGFRPTDEYGGGLSLATAVAVSGAAASPNMGYHSSSSVAALLTVLNLRLARWCPNPAKGEWRHRSPEFAAAPLFAELFGDTSGRKGWVNLSDGGHFENLGLYELVRRRADFILATDVGADGGFHFDDLSMAVRNIWVDFGVRVEIAEESLGAIRPDGTSPFSARHWAYGRIHYPDREPGHLVYVKSSICADAPIDVRQYRDANPAFPHETTSDQWFDEGQFEAYRHLGQRIAELLCSELGLERGGDEPAVDVIGRLCRTVGERFAG